ISLAETAQGKPFTLAELFTDHADDTFVELVGGLLHRDRTDPPSVVARAIKTRDIYRRAYSFAARFIDGLTGLPPSEQKDTRALHWSRLVGTLGSAEGRRSTSKKIYETAAEVCCHI